MLYMVEIRFDPEHRAQVLEYFWQHGTSNYVGKLTIQGAWVASHDKLAYALVDASNEDEVRQSCEPLKEFGEIVYREVTSSDEI